MSDSQAAAKTAADISQGRIPAISIGMPVYNGERYLREAVDSLLAQTFGDFELIISDNASTDATESICRQYEEADRRIRYIRQEANIGVARNFQFVLRQAGSPYFMWAACDDKWETCWLEKMHEAAGETGVGMVFGEVAHIDENGAATGHPASGVTFDYGGADSALTRRLRFYLEYERLGKANCIHSLFVKELTGRLDFMLSEMISGSCPYDYTIMYDCLKYKKIKQVRQATFLKRVHAASASASLGIKTLKLADLPKTALRLLWPFPPKLVRGYLRYSGPLEKVLLLLLLPLKLLAAYRFRLRQLTRG